jgi:predicted GNAT family acetyltransferase
VADAGCRRIRAGHLTGVRIRDLGPGDESALDLFLRRHADSSMFLRSNLRHGGLADRGQRYQGTWMAAEERGEIVAAVMHAWTGTVLPQAPVALPEIVRAVVGRSQRPVRGFVGPLDQAHAAREALGLAGLTAQVDSREDLFSLALDRLVVPPALASGVVRLREPADTELGLLVDWRVVYHVETMNVSDTPARRVICREEIDAYHAERAHWVVEDRGRPVAYSHFNARLPDMVQVGGVWTPPELRGRGYARCVVAGSLRDARDRGVSRASLFTPRTNAPAQRAYRSLGFETVGEYALIFFAEPVAVQLHLLQSGARAVRWSGRRARGKGGA